MNDVNDQPTNQDILEAINTSFSVVQGQLSDIKTDVAILKTDVAVLKTDVAVLKTDVGTLKTDVKELKESTVKTAIFHRAIDAMEDRLTQKIVGEDRKLVAVVRLLEQKKIFSTQEVQELFA